MCDMMTFPDTVEEFMEQYKIVDTKQVYTNGAELVPIFRMKQWFEHLQTIEPERKKGKWIKISPAGIYECSVCGQNVMTNDIAAYKWCHGCGADMRGGEQNGQT